MARRPWTKDEERYLAQRIQSDGVTQCAKALDRPESSVYHKMQRLSLRDSRWWTDEEIEYLNANHGKKTMREIARHLGRTTTAVQSRAIKYGLSKKNYYPPDRYCIDCGKKLGNKYLNAKRCASCRPASLRGENSPHWHGGVSSLYKVARHRQQEWRKAVIKRDGYECHLCGSNRRLHVHHIRPYTVIRDFIIKMYPYLSTSNAEDKEILAQLIADEHYLEDGITLCYDCHRKIHAEKRGELLENRNASGDGNQQPSQSNVVSIVDWKVQRLTGEDTQTNKPDTSAPLSIIDRVMI